MSEVKVSRPARVIIERSWGRDSIDIYILEYDARRRYLAKVVDGELEFYELEGYELPAPTLSIDKLTAGLILPALLAELAKMGYLPPQQEEDEKLLNAFRMNLGDLRSINTELLKLLMEKVK